MPAVIKANNETMSAIAMTLSTKNIKTLKTATITLPSVLPPLLIAGLASFEKRVAASFTSWLNSVALFDAVFFQFSE